jgi:hypothetical protein
MNEKQSQNGHVEVIDVVVFFALRSGQKITSAFYANRSQAQPGAVI